MFAASPAEFLNRAVQAERAARQADGRAELHHGLVEVAWPVGIEQTSSNLLDFCPRDCSRMIPIRATLGRSRQTENDALDISIDYGGSLSEGDAGDGGGGVVADAGKLAQRLRILGYMATIRFDDSLCPTM